MPDDLTVTNGDPRCGRCRAREEPDEVSAWKEDRVAVDLVDPVRNRDESVEVILTPLADLHSAESDAGSTTCCQQAS